MFKSQVDELFENQWLAMAPLAVYYEQRLQNQPASGFMLIRLDVMLLK